MLKVFRAVLSAALVLQAGAAVAQEPILGASGPRNWPTEITRRPLTLGAGMVELTVPVAINESAGSSGKPVSSNPSLYYGVSERWMIGIRHLVGVCFSGKANGCDKAYNDVSLDTVVSLARSSGLELGVGAAVNWAPIDPSVWSSEVRLIARASVGSLALTVAPTVNVGLNDRTSGNTKWAPTQLDLAGTYHLIAVEPALENKEWLLVPATLQLQVGPSLGLMVGASLDGPIDPTVGSYGDYYRVPVAAAVVFTPAHWVDLGASFTFANLAGKDSSTDFRTLGFFAAFRN